MSNYKTIIEQNNTELQGILDTVNELPDYVEPVIESLTVTENGTYTAATGISGYSPVTVNIEGVKMATGTATAASASLGMGQYSYTVTVTGLDFRPSHTVLTAITSSNSGTYAAWGTYDATSYGYYGSTTATYTVSENGFQITTTGGFRFDGIFEGTYRWIAWAE